MKIYYFMLALVVTVVLSGCYSISARHSYDSGTDISGFNSYAWISMERASFSTPESAEHYRSAMDDMLASKGFNLNPANPDFVIFTAPVDTYREKYKSLNGTVQFPKAVLRVSFMTPSSRVPFYEAAAEAFLDENEKQSDKNSIVDQAVEALLENFPPVD